LGIDRKVLHQGSEKNNSPEFFCVSVNQSRNEFEEIDIRGVWILALQGMKQIESINQSDNSLHSDLVKRKTPTTVVIGGPGNNQGGITSSYQRIAQFSINQRQSEADVENSNGSALLANSLAPRRTQN
jgi:hypothetical protein